MKTSFIATVYNESGSINQFLDSIFSQNKKPDEIIIVDGGSTDNTVDIVKKQKAKSTDYKGNFLIIIKKGNRSIGRNEAISHAMGDIIVCSDSGCILDKKWLTNIIQPFLEKSVDVVAGYYKGYATTIFQKCLVPYALVMQDRVDPASFLPATRSMALRKKTWEDVGGFDERLSNNEDYAFAKKLTQKKVKIVFVKDAVAYWIPRRNLWQAFIMFFRFAKGDAESHLFRPKVLFIFIRYLFAVLLFIWNTHILLVLLIVYILWSIQKNYKYVRDLRAIVILPVLQITSDIAVILGTISGLV